MTCDAAQQFLVNAGWDASRRRTVAEFLQHAEQCDVCSAALEDYDAIRHACAPASDELSEPEGGWEAMERRLAASIQDHNSLQQGSRQQLQSRKQVQVQDAPQAGPLNRRRTGWQNGWLRPALAVAASLLMAAGGFEASRFFSPGGHRMTAGSPTFLAETSARVLHPIATLAPPEIPRGQQAPVLAALSPPVVSQAVREFREVSRQGYRGRAGWMLVSGPESSVGMVAAGDPLTKKMLFLRLGLLCGMESVSASDLMIRAGQDADLTVPLPDGQSLHYRIGTSTGEPTRLTVWLDVKTPQGGEPLAVLSTHLQARSGQTLTAGKLATSAGEYELVIEFASADLAEDMP